MLRGQINYTTTSMPRPLLEGSIPWKPSEQEAGESSTLLSHATSCTTITILLCLERLRHPRNHFPSKQFSDSLSGQYRSYSHESLMELS